MRRLLHALPLLTLLACPAAAGPAEDARALYARFVAAQNAHDFDGVRAVILDAPQFLWISNGMALWGPDAMIERLRRFHANEVWRIEPDERLARTVEVTAETAVVTVPLTLTVGPRSGPQRYRILVSALCVQRPAGWRIAALFTTDASPGQSGE